MSEILNYIIIFMLLILMIIVAKYLKSNKYLNFKEGINKSGGNDMEISFFNPINYNLTYDIIEGRKTVEGRVLKNAMAGLKVGDSLILKDKDVNITCEITRIVIYDDVREYVEREGYSTTIPGTKSVDDAVDVYIKYFRVPLHTKFLGIGINPIKVEWQATLKQPHFDDIKKGKKTSEGRLNVGKWKHMHEGHWITFVNNNDKVTAKITKINNYPDFRKMLETEGVERVLPGMTQEDGLQKIYHKYYKPEDAEKHGVIAMQLAVI